ncbi:hypothetical protein MTR_4g019290 [Medicago truncatula]|uniref:Uncharacterized protein n=1 Tax=Medicago truncatula TaxID=3880 RepID=G7JS92_MEDTR|nr:hypothetical protein MTR_4g019290 [Medicago truncatula]
MSFIVKSYTAPIAARNVLIPCLQFEIGFLIEATMRVDRQDIWQSNIFEGKTFPNNSKYLAIVGDGKHAYSPLSCSTFLIMSMSLSTLQTQCGFEVDLLYILLRMSNYDTHED